MADDAGALLVRSGLVSSSSLDAARAGVEEVGGTLGEHLVLARAVDDGALTEFYRQRLLVPQVNPNTLARLAARVVATIPADMAIELRAIPVSLDNENNLTVAMSDPSNRHAVDEIAFFTGTYVVRAVATQMQIAWCLAHYYGHVTQLGTQLIQGNGDATAPTPAAPAPPAQQMPRPRGHTHKVEATRHRGVPPITGAHLTARPSSKPLDDPEPVAAATPPPATTPPATPRPGTPPPTPAATAPRAHRETAPDDDPPLHPSASQPRLRAASEPAVAGASGVVEQPRARSVSGEIRVVKPRAVSIKPELPAEDDSSPIITIEAEPPTADTTAPRKLPQRRTKPKTDPPELAARAGEVDSQTGPVQLVSADEPRIVVDDDAYAAPTVPATNDEAAVEAVPRTASGEITREIANTAALSNPSIVVSSDAGDPDAPVLIHDHGDTQSQPILLERKRGSEPPSNVPTGEDEVVMLDARKPRVRTEKRTVMGIGPESAPTRREPRDTMTDGGVPGEIDDVPTGVTSRTNSGELADQTRLDTPVAPATGESTDETLAAPPAPAKRQRRDSELDTGVMPVVEQPAPAGARTQIDHDPLDDGWGPPGTTIPPPLLGAIPGGVDDDDDGDRDGTIPIANVDSVPLMVGTSSPPEPARASPAAESGKALVRALEQATAQAIELIRKLERANTRDEVVELMTEHLADSHHRAGFFVIKTGQIKGGELAAFSIVPVSGTVSSATLRLDHASTLADVVGTRLPYRGPMHDDASRAFLTSVLGACPAEILLVPVAVRERVVGVLFGEHRRRHTFDDQLALAARAAGQALERIIKTQRS